MGSSCETLVLEIANGALRPLFGVAPLYLIITLNIPPSYDSIYW